MIRPKVLMLTRLFPSKAFPALGTFCLERARALLRHADVRVMVPTPWFPNWTSGPLEWRKWARVEREGLVDGGIRVTYPRYLSIPKFATWSQGTFMAKAVRREMQMHYADWRPDIIDGHFAFPDGYGAVRLARAIGCPSLVTCHGADLRFYPELPVTRSMLSWTLRSADRVISVSAALHRRSIELGCPQQNALLLSNGVDPAKFALRSKADCRRELGLPEERKIGVYVGYLIDRKDQSLVIKALAEIRRAGRPLPLIVLVGDGPNRRRLQDEAAQLQLTEHVVFAGSRPHAEVAAWMGAADWLLLSSDYEGWATVYFEAMSCGRPVLTSNVSSAKDAICEPDYGMVVEPRTPEAFATAMMEASARHFDASAIRAYAELHSWAHWAEQTMNIISDAMRRPNA